MKFRTHVPSCVDADYSEFEINSLVELLSHPEIKRKEALIGFKRWSRTGDTLMKECEDGTWWVVGYAKPASLLNGLPKWQLSKEQLARIEAKNKENESTLDPNTAFAKMVSYEIDLALNQLIEKLSK